MVSMNNLHYCGKDNEFGGESLVVLGQKGSLYIFVSHHFYY